MKPTQERERQSNEINLKPGVHELVVEQCEKDKTEAGESLRVYDFGLTVGVQILRASSLCRILS